MTISAETTFKAKYNPTLLGFLCLGGAFVYFLVLVVIFLLLLLSTKEDSYMPGVLGGMSVPLFALVAQGIFFLKATSAIMLDDEGITIERTFSSQRVRWAEIQSLQSTRRRQFMGSSVEELRILGVNGQLLTTIPNTFLNYAAILEIIEQRAAGVAGKPVRDVAGEKAVARTRSKKSRRLIFIVGPLMLLLFAACFLFDVNEIVHLRRYATEGVQTDAHIDRRWIESVTPRLVYTFADPSGKTHTRDLSMKQAAWDGLVGRNTVRVEYLRSDPEWNRPLAGESEEPMGVGFLFLSGGGFVFFAFMLVFVGLGYDAETMDGRFVISRYGEVIKAFGKGKDPGHLPPAMS